MDRTSRQMDFRRRRHQWKILVSLLVLSANVSTSAPDEDPAMSDARSNAKSALLLALEELQKNAGPDQRVTARADLLDGNIANPHLTGVWDSWEIKATNPPTAADYEKPAKEAKFRTWLVSNPDPAAAREVSFASQPLASPVTLWGRGTLGMAAPSNDLVAAARVSVSSPAGAYAWAILDEGVKARINTPYSDTTNGVAAKTFQLGSGERPATEFIAGLENLSRDSFKDDSADFKEFIKGIGDANFALTAERLAPGTREALKSLTHDVSLHSLGLFTDTARGGFRQDFQMLTEPSSLPSAYSGQGVYGSRLGMAASSAPSDPRWASLQEFARLYRDSGKLTNSGGSPVLKTQAPRGWTAASVYGDPSVTTTTTVNRTPPPGLVLLPTIAKVQMVFSLIGRDLYSGLPATVTGPLTKAQKMNGINGPQDGYFRNSKYDYSLHLLFMPMVTLHNPYNVALEFNTLKVEFIHVPFAMKIYRSGQAQTPSLIPLEQMADDNSSGQKGKVFVMNLKTKTNSRPGDVRVKLMPGEVKMFSPYIDPNLDYLNRSSYWDLFLSNSKTANMDAMPGWRGDAVGFDCDWLAGNQLVNQDHMQGHWGGCIGLAWDDRIYVEFAPLGNSALSQNKFAVNMRAITGTSSTPEVVSSIELDYEKPTGLQEFIASTGEPMPMRYPKASTNPNYVTGLQLVDRATTKIKDIKNAKAFALLSLQAKTTSGAKPSNSSDLNNIDGRLATKPWCFAHANIGASSQKVLTEHSANFSHEFDLQRLPGNVDNWVDTDAQDRGNFVSGHTFTNGTKFGIQYDIPLGPLQTLASLNGANPGGSSGYLPRFAHPIGNSWAHPLISADKLLEPMTGGNYLDHSFLLNLALYDGFYFSGLADQSGPFGSRKSSAELALAFASGKPLDDPRLLLYRPDGKIAAGFPGEVAKPAAYANIAAWQLMKGAFNINSTSVPAWKAMLASIHDSEAVFSALDKVTGNTTITRLPSTESGEEARISRFRLPASKSAADGATDIQAAYWMGPREYSDAELQKFAENIVKQVRLRGPFLSMAEFVNRRLGPASDDMSQRGALQHAIDDSDLNAALANQAEAGFDIDPAQVGNYRYRNQTAGTGMSSQGAPGFLTQADILNVLGNAATARSDTFTIRSYGEAHDAAGKITASATCEAIVQRLPDWVDPADPAETKPAALTSETNRTQGRRFRLLAFRWLDPDEI